MDKLFEGALRIFEVSGTHIAYRSAGNGPALLLLHGYPQTMYMWHLVADRLAENYTVVLPDFRSWHGQYDIGYQAYQAQSWNAQTRPEPLLAKPVCRAGASHNPVPP